MTTLASACQESIGSEKPEDDEAWLEVENSTVTTVVEMNLVDAGLGASGLWGRNQLSEEQIHPGQVFVLKGIQPCPQSRDLRLVNDEGAVHTDLDRNYPCAETIALSITGFQ